MSLAITDLKGIALAASQVVHKAAAFIKQETIGFDHTRVQYKGLNDLVSYVDKTAEEILTNGLAAINPTFGFLTEEGTVEQAASTSAKPFWIIDPLDGTTNFVHGLPVFAVSVALYHAGELLVGIVHEVNHAEHFLAWSGGGATCNGKPIMAGSQPELGRSLLATGFPYNNFEGVASYLEILRILMERSHGLRRMGSASVDLAYVAMGRFQGFFEYNLKPWDVAAGALLVKEAGGTVTDFSGGNQYLFGGQIVAGGKIQQDLQTIIEQNWQVQ